MITIIKSNKNKEMQEINITDRHIISIGLALVSGTSTITKVHADSIAESFMPLVVVLQDLAEPVSYGFMIKGFLQIMAGNDHAGQKTIKNSIGGFLGIQFIPKIFEIIRSIKL